MASVNKYQKLKNGLLSASSEREKFEKQRKELESQMHKGKENLGKIEKSLRGPDKAIGLELDLDANIKSPMASGKKMSVASTGFTPTAAQVNASVCTCLIFYLLYLYLENIYICMF